MIARITVCAAIAVSLCFAQATTVPQIKVVKNSPFTATATTQSAQTLSDGNHISHSVDATLTRDSAGRTRREQVLANGASVVFIEDPVAGYGYAIDSAKKLVRRFSVGNAETTTASTTGEQLGTQVIESLVTQGSRSTRTIKAGEAGNEQTFDVVIEAWYSSELQTVILRKTTDPRFGETTYKLTKIDRAEPDSTLFQIPLTFSIVDDLTIAK